MNQFSVVICDDIEHESLFAEIQFGGKCVAMISQEDGPDQLKLEIPGPNAFEDAVARVVPLNEFLEAVTLATRQLLGAPD